ncbi:hypothetical protein KSP40_PGU001289 [Platanthera guangdongensis]|uniref:Uncharacterized protein n=1 Tax=Platanthera guangdongensis TaxID=2320717 RepID=A0ABR2ML54_9ASPA
MGDIFLLHNMNDDEASPTTRQRGRQTLPPQSLDGSTSQIEMTVTWPWRPAFSQMPRNQAEPPKFNHREASEEVSELEAEVKRF